MASKVAVVTGGDKGVGFAIVKALCSKFKGDVYLTARDEETGKTAVKELKKEGLTVKFHLLDIKNLESIKALAVFLKEKYDGLDVLVNNAGITYMAADSTPFEKQAENAININFFGTLNVCHELFPLLKPYARVVNVSSSRGMLYNIPRGPVYEKLETARTDLTEPELCQLMNEFIEEAKKGVHSSKWGNSAYNVSKVGITALTFLQAAAFENDPRADIVINAVNPNYGDIDMPRDRCPIMLEQGSKAAVYLALLPPSVEKPRGELVWSDRDITSWSLA